MSFTACAGIGILLVLAIIGLLIWVRHDSFKSESSNRIYIVTGALQIFYIVLYLTGLLDKITQINAYIAFGICAVVSVLCVLMSVWMLLPFSNYKHGIKFLFMFCYNFYVFAARSRYSTLNSVLNKQAESFHIWSISPATGKPGVPDHETLQGATYPAPNQQVFS